MTYSKKLALAAGLAVVIIAAFILFVNFYVTSRYQSGASPQTGGEVTRTFTLEELRKYDGTDENLPIYIGLDGLVYDVTAGKKFYVSGGPYHYLAGKDSSVPLRVIGGDIIKRKYPVVGKLAQ